MVLGQMSPDLAARQLMMAAFLYYSCASSVISDAENDELAKYVAHNWDYLLPEIQERLDSPQAILATTSHVLVSKHTVGAAMEWALMMDARIEAWPEWQTDAIQDTPSGQVELMAVRG